MIEEIEEHYHQRYDDDYFLDTYITYAETYGIQTVDDFLNHMKHICGDDDYSSAFFDLSNHFTYAVVDKTQNVNLEELEYDYFICGEYVFNPYWENEE